MQNSSDIPRLRPLVSVIVPIYNAARYLPDAVQSVLGQEGICFEADIQLILVNDGSADESGRLCEAYAQQYPNNTVYIQQGNCGVSAARNRGIEHASGDYCYFLDADDCLSERSLADMLELFATLEDDGCQMLPFVAQRVIFFEGRQGEHRLNSKFDQGDRLIELDAEPASFVMHVNSCLFRRQALAASRFDEGLELSEDACFILDVLLANGMCYGVVSTSHINYRRRGDGSNSIAGKHLRKDWYVDTVERFYQRAFKEARSPDGSVLKFVQYMVMYDLQWRFLQRGLAEIDVLTPDELNAYRQSLFDLVDEIDDDVIFAQRKLGRAHKVALLNLKYGHKWHRHLRITRSCSLFFGDLKLFNIKSSSTVDNISAYLDPSRKELIFEGFIRQNYGLPTLGYHFLWEANGIVRELVVEQIRISERDVFLADQLVEIGRGFRLHLDPQLPVQKLRCECRFFGDDHGEAGPINSVPLHFRYRQSDGSYSSDSFQDQQLLGRYWLERSEAGVLIKKFRMRWLLRAELRRYRFEVQQGARRIPAAAAGLAQIVTSLVRVVFCSVRSLDRQG